MVSGDLVNTAARLQGAGEPGWVLVGEATRRATEEAIRYESVGEHQLKGKSEGVAAWRAIAVLAGRGAVGRADALEPPFVGRDTEFHMIKELLHAAGRERRARLVSIVGIAGIGGSARQRGGVDEVARPFAPQPGAPSRAGVSASFLGFGRLFTRSSRRSARPWVLRHARACFQAREFCTQLRLAR
jgi:hypothetical protein